MVTNWVLQLLLYVNPIETQGTERLKKKPSQLIKHCIFDRQGNAHHTIATVVLAISLNPVQSQRMQERRESLNEDN